MECHVTVFALFMLTMTLWSIIVLTLSDEETEAQRSRVTCPRSHSEWAVESGFNFRSADATSHSLPYASQLPCGWFLNSRHWISPVPKLLCQLASQLWPRTTETTYYFLLSAPPVLLECDFNGKTKKQTRTQRKSLCRCGRPHPPDPGSHWHWIHCQDHTCYGLRSLVCQPSSSADVFWATDSKKSLMEQVTGLKPAMPTHPGPSEPELNHSLLPASTPQLWTAPFPLLSLCQGKEHCLEVSDNVETGCASVEWHVSEPCH